MKQELRNIEADLQSPKIRSSKELPQSSEKLINIISGWRSAFDAISDVILVYDSNFLVVNANYSATVFFKQISEQLIGQSYLQLFDKSTFISDQCLLKQVKETNRHYEIEIRVANSDKWMLSSADPILDDKGNMLGIVHLIRDITKTKQTQNMLRISKERLELALKGADLGMWDWDIETGKVVFNHRWAQMLGYLVKDIEPHIRSWEMLVHPDDNAQTSELLNAHLQGKSASYESEHRLKTKMGDWKWILDRGKIVQRDENGKPLRMTGTHLDITEQKNLARKIEENQINLRSFFDSVENLLSVMDMRGTVLEVNRSLTERLGYTREELIGKNILTLHPEQYHLEAQETVLKMVEGSVKSCPLPLVTKDGMYIPAETYVVRGLWSGLDVLFCVSKDISAIKESEEKFYKAFHSNAALMAISTVGDGCFIDVNEQFCTTLGYSHDDVIGKTPEQINLFVDHHQRNEVKKAILESSSIKDVNIAVRDRLGRIRYGLFSADILNLQNGEFLLTVMNDITDRKLAEDALKQVNSSLELEVGRRTADLNEANLRMKDEITLRRRAEETLRYRLSIEVAMAKSSKLFLSSDTVDINEVLGILGIAVSANRAYIFEFDTNLNRMDNTYEWCDQLTTPEKDNLQGIDTAIMPWWFGKLIRNEVIIINDVAKMPPEAKTEQDVLSAQLIKSLLVVPMFWSSGELAGFMGFDDTSNCRVWLHEDIDALKVMAKMTMLYWEHKNAKRESTLHQEQLTALSGRLLQMREQERKNIAREIHDELGTVLTVMKFDLSWLGKRISSAYSEIQAKIVSMSKTIDDMIIMVQKICTELRPGLLDNMGLIAAIEWHIAEFQKRTEIQCEIDLPESLILESKNTIDIFRIFQELLTNVARHSGAGNVAVRLYVEDEVLTLTIEDDGCGIGNESIDASNSLGLIGIRERVKYLNGKFSITGVRGTGTMVVVSIPFTGKDNNDTSIDM